MGFVFAHFYIVTSEFHEVSSVSAKSGVTR